MHKKGSILIISLWILAILVVFAVSLGHRVAINLKLSRFQRDKLKAQCLANAGINKVILELQKDTNDNDNLKETWSTGIEPITNEALFENIEIEPESGERFTCLCIDEERKININTASPEVLAALLKELKFEASQAQEIANYVCVWRGDTDASLPKIEGFKNSLFTTPEELSVVLEYFFQKNNEANSQERAQNAYKNMQGLITVYSTEKININTAQEIIFTALAKTKTMQPQFVETLIPKIINFRESVNGPFDEEKLNNFAETQLTESEEKNIFNNMRPHLGCVSNYFRIESQGEARGIKKKITAVVKRATPAESVYWHEN